MAKMTRNQERAMFAKQDKSGKNQRVSDSLSDVKQVRYKRQDVSESPIVKAMREHDEKIKLLTGEKQRMSNPVTRALYEEKSLKSGRWLSIEEFEDELQVTK